MNRSTRAAVVAAAVGLFACAEIGSGPDVPAAIELTALPSPSVVIGDTLRTIDGVVAPVQAIVRNLAGDVIPDAQVRYLYADFLRDSALAIDSVTGLVRALRVSKGSGGDARLAARAGTSLQILKSLIVTTRPDTTDRSGLSAPTLFVTSLPDTGRTAATANTSPELSLIVRNIDSLGVASGVNGWPVRFVIVEPANAANDTTKGAWLVDDAGRASVLDTTNSSGQAGRKVRIRAAVFPAVGVNDSVVVQATMSYRGVVVRGAPVRITLPVKRDTTP